VGKVEVKSETDADIAMDPAPRLLARQRRDRSVTEPMKPLRGRRNAIVLCGLHGERRNFRNIPQLLKQSRLFEDSGRPTIEHNRGWGKCRGEPEGRIQGGLVCCAE
jgi:hypothetical protein